LEAKGSSAVKVEGLEEENTPAASRSCSKASSRGGQGGRAERARMSTKDRLALAAEELQDAIVAAFEEALTTVWGA
jgi:hypothetical protein